jgi:hypothetical protein
LCAHGQLLGAAAIAYSDLPWDLMVIESCYVDIDEALHARLPWVPVPQLLLWPLRRSAEWWSGTSAVRLRPNDALAKRRLPTFFLCGAADTKVGFDGTQRLAAGCAAAAGRLRRGGCKRCIRQAKNPAEWTDCRPLRGLAGGLNRR